MSQLFLLAVSLFSFLAVISSADYFISPFGDDTNPGTQASPFRHVSFGLSKASAFDKIFLLPGTYGYDNKFNVVQNATIVAFSSQVFLSCQAASGSQYVTFNSQSIWLTLQNITFLSCASAIDMGEGTGQALNLYGVTFSQNTRGISVEEEGNQMIATIACDSCDFNNNNFGIYYSQGYGLLSLRLSNTIFAGNSVGINVYPDGGPPTQGTWSITTSQFQSNGVALSLNSNTVSISHSVFTRNGNMTLTPGSAVQLVRCALSLDTVSMSGNMGSTGGAVFLDQGSALSAANSVFDGNMATSQGGVFFEGTNIMVNLQSCGITNNMANTAGAFYCSTSTNSFLVCDSCTLSGNTSKDGSPISNCGSMP